MRLDLIVTIRDICIMANLNPLIKFTTSSRNLDFKDILLWSISEMFMKTVLIILRIVISNTIKQGISL